MAALICPKCHKAAVLQRSSSAYRDRCIWTCNRCDTSVGCHPGTTKPLGSLADELLRLARQDAHAAFDRLWKAKMRRDKVPKPTARRAAYKWLGEQMGLTKAKCHIALMNITQCRHVVAICRPYHAENRIKDQPQETRTST